MRLTTNTPQGNLEQSLNLFYAKDGIPCFFIHLAGWVCAELHECLKRFEDEEDARE